MKLEQTEIKALVTDYPGRGMGRYTATLEVRYLLTSDAVVPVSDLVAVNDLISQVIYKSVDDHLIRQESALKVLAANGLDRVDRACRGIWNRDRWRHLRAKTATELELEVAFEFYFAKPRQIPGFVSKKNRPPQFQHQAYHYDRETTASVLSGVLGGKAALEQVVIDLFPSIENAIAEVARRSNIDNLDKKAAVFFAAAVEKVARQAEASCRYTARRKELMDELMAEIDSNLPSVVEYLTKELDEAESWTDEEKSRVKYLITVDGMVKEMSNVAFAIMTSPFPPSSPNFSYNIKKILGEQEKEQKRKESVEIKE